MPLQPDVRDFERLYRNSSDQEIAALFADKDSLTDVARDALLAEIRRRGISGTELSRLYTLEVRREAKFDRRQMEHREQVARTIFRGDPKQTLIWILVMLGIAVLIWMLKLIH